MSKATQQRKNLILGLALKSELLSYDTELSAWSEQLSRHPQRHHTTLGKTKVEVAGQHC